jgi:hypothetical protein
VEVIVNERKFHMYVDKIDRQTELPAAAMSRTTYLYVLNTGQLEFNLISDIIFRPHHQTFMEVKIEAFINIRFSLFG